MDMQEKQTLSGETQHKRRVHYSGKYPKKFEEKYKEHAPEKYADTIDHVLSKGSTPAGMHVSICVNEILEVLSIKEGERGLDCTLGYGGHTGKMLEALHGTGHVTSLDIDPIESVKTEARLRERGFSEEQLAIMHINFADADQAAAKYGKFDFMLADLGVSSMQIDNPERGFSYKLDGPLDLRMNPELGQSAAERLKEMTADEISSMLMENADEPFAAEIAARIRRHVRAKKPLETTTDLRNLITETLTDPKLKIPKAELKDTIKKTCQRCFQAIRIDVNHEYETLYSLLEKLPDIMNPGGRIAFLTFHSGEDRLVKRMFKEHVQSGAFSEACKDVIRPSAEECAKNGRAKSAKLRWAIKA